MRRRDDGMLALVLVLAACGTPPPHMPDSSLMLECEVDGDCDDGNACTGQDMCVSGSCDPGTPPTDHVCPTPPGEEGPSVCVEMACVQSTCGDGVVDPRVGEMCDDHNDISGDGCDADCTFISCTSDLRCDDGDPCNGDERCSDPERGGHCIAGTPPTCPGMGDPCVIACDETGCVEPHPLDEDGDGDGPLACGADCDDADPTSSSHGEEICDGRDNDCDADVDEGLGELATHYVDCDGDGYAVDEIERRLACRDAVVTIPPSRCPDGAWTTRSPAEALDCNDDNAAVHPAISTDVFFTDRIPGAPAESDYDYDCSGMEEEQWAVTTASGCSATVLSTTGCGPSGGSSVGFIEAEPPDCGDVGMFFSCAGGSGPEADGPCRAITTTVRQGCR